MRLNSDRSLGSPQFYRFSHWLDISIVACCLVFVLSGYGYAATEPEMTDLRALSGALPIGQSSGVAAPAAELSISASSLAFGNVTVGSTATLPITVTSTGTAPLTINSAAIRGLGFRASGAAFPLTLNPQQSATLQVRAAALRIGAMTGTLTVRSNSSANPTITISLTSTGVARGNPQMRVSPNSLNFGKVIVGSTATLPVTVASTGTAPLTISSATIGNTEFAVSGTTFPITLNPKQMMTLSITFASAEVSTIRDTLIISSNAVRHSRTAIRLASTGVAQPTPQLTVSASSLSFGNVTVGSSATLPVTLTSTGSAPLTIKSRSIHGTGFAVSGATFPITLNPSQAVTLHVTFAPKAAKAATGTLMIGSNATRHSAIAVSLISQGVAPQLTVSATSLSFGTVNDGSSAMLPLTLTSTGTASLTINSAQISGTGFTVSGATFPVTLIPPLGITLQVQFSPTAGIPALGTVTISSTDPTNPSTVVGLSGTGQYVVNLRWDAPVDSPDPVARYDIYRSTGNSSSYELLNSIPNNQTTYVDTSVQPGTTYNYYVTSVDRSGAQSGPSNTVTVPIPQGLNSASVRVPIK